MGLQRALEALDRRAVAPLRLGVERDQGEAAAGMRLLGVVQAQLLGDREESAVVVAAGTGGVADAARGGDAMDCFMEQPFEGELVPQADDDSPIRDSGAARSGSSGWYR